MQITDTMEHFNFSSEKILIILGSCLTFVYIINFTYFYSHIYGIIKVGGARSSLVVFGNDSSYKDIKSDLQDEMIRFEDLPKSLKLSGIQPYVNILDEEMPKFSSNYKNPCWKEETSPGSGISKLRCLPYFYIAGFPKCGTTDLFYHLTLHPEVSEVRKKEIAWWAKRRVEMCDDETDEVLKHDLNVDDAHLCGETMREFVDFSQLSTDNIESYTVPQKGSNEPYHPMIYGDGTPATMYMLKYWHYLPENKGCDEKKGPRYNIGHYIRHVTPEARIIVTMRKPAEQVYSWYVFFHGRDVDRFHQMVLDEIKLIESCLKERTLWACASNYTHGVLRIKRVNLWYALYYPYVAEWLKVFPRNQMYFSQKEHYAKVKRLPVLNEIFNFLGLDPLDNKVEDEIMNSEVRRNRSDVHETIGEMLPDTRKVLDKFYAPYNKMLADLLNDKKWLFED